MPPDAAPRYYEALLAAWPAAEITRLGPWTLRRGDGGSRTAAASLDGPPGDIAAAEAAMRGWGQRPLFIIRPGDEALDAALAARDYAVPDRTVICAAAAARLAAPGGEAAIPCAAPLAAMVEIWAAGGVGPKKLATMARAPAPRLYLLGRLGDRPAGCAFAAIHRGTAMLSALEIAGFARRHGLAGRLVRAAAAWAAERGAATLALAVKEENAAARALYAGLAMTETGGYHYRIAPERSATREEAQ